MHVASLPMIRLTELILEKARPETLPNSRNCRPIGNAFSVTQGIFMHYSIAGHFIAGDCHSKSLKAQNEKRIPGRLVSIDVGTCFDRLVLIERNFLLDTLSETLKVDSAHRYSESSFEMMTEHNSCLRVRRLFITLRES